MNPKILILLLSGLGLLTMKVSTQSLAPTVLAAGGGTADDAKVRVAWTLGETIIQTAGTVTQGFHSAEIQLFSSAAAPMESSLVRAFPNPVDGIFTLQFEDGKPRPAGQVYICNALAQQQIVYSIPPGAAAYDINCTMLTPGVYWLALRHEDGSLVFTSRFVKY